MRDPRNKMALTSLEEDFKNIGILEDDASEEEVVEDEDALESDEEISENDEELSEDELEERMIRAAGGRKKVKVKKMKAGEKAAARRMYRKRKSKIKKLRKKRARSARGKKLAKLAKSMAAKMRKESVETPASERINSVLEDVQNIVASLNEDVQVEMTEEEKLALENAIKSFANVAIISEMLSDFFAEAVELAEEDEELSEELAQAAQYFQEQAEEAAYLASALDEGTELDEDLDVDGLFQTQMTSLVDGLEFYADLTEDEDDDEEEVVAEEEDIEESANPSDIVARMKAKLEGNA